MRLGYTAIAHSEELVTPLTRQNQIERAAPNLKKEQNFNQCLHQEGTLNLFVHVFYVLAL